MAEDGTGVAGRLRGGEYQREVAEGAHLGLGIDEAAHVDVELEGGVLSTDSRDRGNAPSSAARRLSSGMYTSVVVDTGAEIRVGVAVLAPSLSCASADEIEPGRRSVATTSAASARNA